MALVFFILIHNSEKFEISILLGRRKTYLSYAITLEESDYGLQKFRQQRKITVFVAITFFFDLLFEVDDFLTDCSAVLIHNVGVI